jgi:hypothetical protein
MQSGRKTRWKNLFRATDRDTSGKTDGMMKPGKSEFNRCCERFIDGTPNGCWAY